MLKLAGAAGARVQRHDKGNEFSNVAWILAGRDRPHWSFVVHSKIVLTSSDLHDCETTRAQSGIIPREWTECNDTAANVAACNACMYARVRAWARAFLYAQNSYHCLRIVLTFLKTLDKIFRIVKHQSTYVYAYKNSDK